jgi:hypothetical protein
MNWVVQFDKEFIQKLGRKEMKRYGMTVKYSGTVYVEVDCPNGENPEEYGMDVASPMDVEDWEIVEVYGIEEVDPNE